MKSIFAVILVYGCALCDGNVVIARHCGTLHPALLPVLGIVWVALFTESTAVLLAAVTGMVSDAISAGPLGIDTALMVLWTLAVSRFAGRDARVSLASVVVIVGLAFLSVISVRFLSVTLRSLGMAQPYEPLIVGPQIVGRAIGTSVLVLIVSSPLRLLLRLQDDQRSADSPDSLSALSMLNLR